MFGWGYPFWTSGHEWSIGYGGTYWECDDFINTPANATVHRVFFR